MATWTVKLPKVLPNITRHFILVFIDIEILSLDCWDLRDPQVLLTWLDGCACKLGLVMAQLLYTTCILLDGSSSCTTS